MPKEYSQSGGQASPNPSQFGSAEIRLDNPQFVAQTAVDVGVNPFEQLQGILKSAVGASASYLQNKTNIVEGQMAVEQAKYVRNQRAIADQDRMERNKQEDIQRNIVRMQTQMHKFYATEMFKEADATLTQIEEQATDDSTKAWAAQERLQMQTAMEKADDKARGISAEERGLVVGIHKQLAESFGQMKLDEDERQKNGLPSQFAGLSGDALHAAWRDAMMLKSTNSPGLMTADVVGLPGWYDISQQSRDTIETQILNDATQLALHTNASRQEERVRNATAVREQTLKGLPYTLQNGSLDVFQDYTASVTQDLLENKISESDHRRLLQSAATSFGANYKSSMGMSGAAAAAAENEAMFTKGVFTQEQAGAANIAIQKRLKEEYAKAEATVITRAQNGDPSDPYSLTHLPGRASSVMLEEMGITAKDAGDMGFGDNLNRLNDRQEAETRQVEANAAQDKRAADILTIYDIERQAAKAAQQYVKGTPEFQQYSDKLDARIGANQGNPKILAKLEQAKLSFLKDDRAYIASLQRGVKAEMDLNARGQEHLVNTMADEARVLVNDTFTAALNEPDADKRKALFSAALDFIKTRRTESDSENLTKQYSAAELSLTRGLKGQTVEPGKTTFGVTEANDITEAAFRVAKDLPLSEQSGVFRQMYDSLIEGGTWNPRAIKHLEDLVKQGGNDTSMVMDVMKRSGALNGAPGVSTMFQQNAPLAWTASLLSKADSVSKAIARQDPTQDVDRLAAHVALADQLLKESSKPSAFATGKKEEEDVNVLSPLLYSKQINEGLKTVYNLTGNDLTVYSFNADDRQVFDVMFRQGLSANKSPMEAIVLGVTGMQSLGYSAVKVGTKLDFVFDPHGVVPQDLESKEPGWFGADNSNDATRLGRKGALQALKTLPQFASLTDDQASNLTIEWVMDDRYIRQENGGVPFNIIFPNGDRVNYADTWKAGEVPVVSRKDVEAAANITKVQSQRILDTTTVRSQAVLF